MFRTEVQLPPAPVSINLTEKILTAGSCFSDAIGKALQENKFTVSINPFGTSYNPHAIHKALRYALHNQVVAEHTYLENNGVHANYDFHSKFSALNKNNLKQSLKDTIGATHYFLKDTGWIFITYGTAWVYERNDTCEIVSNCHQMPAAQFSKHLLSQKKVLESFHEFYQDLKTFNPNGKIILTVSPVRHIKDTLPLNSVSKAVLRLASQTLSETYPDVFYFPAFEIMTDDLRDYRFYKPDMIHPSEEAEDYIWKKFAEYFFDKTTQDFIRQWTPLRQALHHKPFHVASPAHQRFLKSTLAQLEVLQSKVNLEKEIQFVKSQLLSDLTAS
jgi:hypothetical protein